MQLLLKLRHLVIVVAIAAFAVGGSFTCKSTTGGSEFTNQDPPPHPAK